MLMVHEGAQEAAPVAVDVNILDSKNSAGKFVFCVWDVLGEVHSTI